MRHQTRKARRRSNARSRSYVKNYQPCKLSVQDAVITCYIKPKSSSTISITGEHAQVRVNTAPAPVLPPPPVTPKTVLKTPVHPQPQFNPMEKPQATTTTETEMEENPGYWCCSPGCRWSGSGWLLYHSQPQGRRLMTDSKVELKGDQGATTIIRGGWPRLGLLFTIIILPL